MGYRAVVERGYLFFFFQAEDGIRDGTVTGVQTCALPIYPQYIKANFDHFNADDSNDRVKARIEQAVARSEEKWSAAGLAVSHRQSGMTQFPRSEERRVGKECRSRWTAQPRQKKIVKRLIP